MGSSLFNNHTHSGVFYCIFSIFFFVGFKKGKNSINIPPQARASYPFFSGRLFTNASCILPALLICGGARFNVIKSEPFEQKRGDIISIYTTFKNEYLSKFERPGITRFTLQKHSPVTPCVYMCKSWANHSRKWN